MHIFNDIVARKRKGLTTLYIGLPETFLGQEKDPNKSNRGLANTCGWNPGTSKDLHPNQVQEQNLTSILEGRIADFEDLRKNPDREGEDVVLADDTIKIRGYGASLAVMSIFPDGGTLGLRSPKFYFPHRDMGAPGDRLIWDACAGLTCFKNETYSWMDHMILEAIEELTFTCGNDLVVPYVTGEGVTESELLAFCPNAAKSRDITTENAQKLGIQYEREVPLELAVTSPGSAVRVVQHLEDGSVINFNAAALFESKFSALELCSYGVLKFPNNVDPRGIGLFASTYPAFNSVLGTNDSEVLPNGAFVNREIHELDGYTGIVRCFQNGTVIRESSIEEEIARRNCLRAQSGEPEKIPPYNASVKAAAMTNKENLLYKPPSDVLDAIKFGL